jgi:hypothetical protein
MYLDLPPAMLATAMEAINHTNGRTQRSTYHDNAAQLVCRFIVAQFEAHKQARQDGSEPLTPPTIIGY